MGTISKFESLKTFGTLNPPIPFPASITTFNFRADFKSTSE